MELAAARGQGKVMVAHDSETLYVYHPSLGMMRRKKQAPDELLVPTRREVVPATGWHEPDPQGCADCRTFARYLPRATFTGGEAEAPDE